jgi:hypothetical protein
MERTTMDLALRRATLVSLLVLGSTAVLAAEIDHEGEQESGAEAAPVMQISTKQGTVDCANRHVEVLAEGAELTFTGKCLELYFLGKDTRASIQEATLVQVVADDVAVAVEGSLGELRQLGHRGSHRLGNTDSAYVQGDANELSASSFGTLELIGSRNRVQWLSGTPATNDFGKDNQLQAIR